MDAIGIHAVFGGGIMFGALAILAASFGGKYIAC